MTRFSHRLRTPAEYAHVFAAPEQRLRGALWMWLVRAQPIEVAAEAEPAGLSARLGLAVARKHLPRAVARNRVKRVAREAFRAMAAELGGLDVVLITTQPSKQKPPTTRKRPSKTQLAAQAASTQALWQTWLKPRGVLLQQFKHELASLRPATEAAVAQEQIQG
jgi:ribonuclease P protein component